MCTGNGAELKVRALLLLVQSGQDWLPFLEGLSALTARLPAREAAAVAQHLQNTARPLNPTKSSRE